MEYEDKVYKKSNLEHNDSISTYDGWGAQQNPNAFEVFYNFLNEIKPLRILEIVIYYHTISTLKIGIMI